MPHKTVTQPLLGLPDNEHLPAELHELADRWRALSDRLDELSDRANEIQLGDIPRAENADHLALRRALMDGLDPLPYGDDKTRAATAELAAVERQHLAAEHALRELGKQVLRELKRHRGEIASLVRPSVEAAVDAYAQALADAKRTLRETGSALSVATGDLLFLRSLDDDYTEVEPDTLPVPPPDMTAERRSLDRVREALDLLDRPAPASSVLVRYKQNQRVFRSSASRAYSDVVVAGTHEYVDPTDAERVARALGYAEVPAPDAA